MSPIVLGLDIGGANLKAATADKRAVTLPFPLWKEPDGLARKLAELLTHFDGVEEFAVTMTGELCDCYETKREGVTRILTAVQNVSRCYSIRVWSTEGKFVTVDEAKQNYLKVAAANWHALATFAGGYCTRGTALLLDMGSTTTDLIPILDGLPWANGKTDTERLRWGELVYTGVRRTPVCAALGGQVAAELFATAHDAYLLLGHTPEDCDDTDTADSRPSTKAHAHARMSRMICSDPDQTPPAETLRLAELVYEFQFQLVKRAVEEQLRRLHGTQRESLGTNRVAVLSGSGEFLVRRIVDQYRREFTDFISLTDRLGPTLAACAPAYALALLATERRS